MTSSGYEQLKATGKLPSPTGIALEVLRMANARDSSIEDIATLIGKDPALGARILRVVNSAWVGTHRTTDTILDAVKLLGTRTVVSLSLGFSLISRYHRGVCPAFDCERFWAESCIGATAARHCSFQFGGRLPDQTYTCRLLSKIGRLAFATACPEDYARVLDGEEKPRGWW